MLIQFFIYIYIYIYEADDDDEDDDDDDDDDDDEDDDHQQTWRGLVQLSRTPALTPASTNEWDILASELYGVDEDGRPYFFEARLEVTSNCVRASEEYIWFHDRIDRFEKIFDEYDPESGELTSELLENGGTKII